MTISQLPNLELIAQLSEFTMVDTKCWKQEKEILILQAIPSLSRNIVWIFIIEMYTINGSSQFIIHQIKSKNC